MSLSLPESNSVEKDKGTMPVIEVSLLPTDTSQDVLEALYDRLWVAVESIPALGLTKARPHDITILFPFDLMKKGIGEYFLIRVGELTPKTERTYEVRKSLGEALRSALLEFFPNAKFIEVIVKEGGLRDVIVVHDDTSRDSQLVELLGDDIPEHLRNADWKPPGYPFLP